MSPLLSVQRSCFENSLRASFQCWPDVISEVVCCLIVKNNVGLDFFLPIIFLPSLNHHFSKKIHILLKHIHINNWYSYRIFRIRFGNLTTFFSFLYHYISCGFLTQYFTIFFMLIWDALLHCTGGIKGTSYSGIWFNGIRRVKLKS